MRSTLLGELEVDAGHGRVVEPDAVAVEVEEPPPVLALVLGGGAPLLLLGADDDDEDELLEEDGGCGAEDLAVGLRTDPLPPRACEL